MPIPPSIDYDRELEKYKELYPDLPTKEELVRALTAVEVSPKERRILEAHYSAPHRTATVTELARMVGYPHYQPINRQYGGLGRRLCLFLNRKYNF